MKTINILTIISLFALIFVISCNKDNDFQLEQSQISPDIEVLHYSSNKSGNTSIMSFRDIKTIESTIKQLKEDYEQHDLDFVETYKHLDIDALNKKDEEIGFNEYQPLIDFSNRYNHKSLLSDYISYETEWLSQEELDTDKDPSKIFDDIQVSELTILNTDKAVIVGGVIYKYIKGGTIEILDANFETLNAINQFNTIDQINVKSFNKVKLYVTEFIDIKETMDDCDNWEKNYFSWTYDNSGTKYRMHYNQYYYRNYDWNGWKLKFHAETKSYKKNNCWLCSWKTWRAARIKAGLRGEYDCSPDSYCGDQYFGFSTASTTTTWNAKRADYWRIHDGDAVSSSSHIYVEEYVGYYALRSYHQIIKTSGGTQYNKTKYFF